MSLATIADLEQQICNRNRCWRTAQVREAGVIAEIGAHWRILLLDAHYSSCASRRIGGMCDGVAAYPQDSNDRLRLIELKQSIADAPAALPQLTKGGEQVAAKLPNGLRGLHVTAEIHVRRAPRQTLRYRGSVQIANRRVEVTARRNGEPV